MNCLRIIVIYFRAVETINKSRPHFRNIQDLLKNAMFMRQQISYEQIRKWVFAM